MVTMRVCLPLPRRRFCSDRLKRHLSEKARQCPSLSLRACAYLLSLLGTCLLARAEPCETLFELAEHLLQFDELARAKASRDLGINRFGGRRDGSHQLHALFRDRDHAAALVRLGGLALDQIARLEITQDAR